MFISYPNKDLQLFKSVFDQYYRGLVVYANRHIEDYPAAEDIVHDLFISVWENWENLKKENIKSYLFYALRNRCFNYISHKNIRTKYQEHVLSTGEIAGLLTWEFYVESELKENIEKAIMKLPPQAQRVFIMSKFEYKSHKEIAEILNISPRTVEKHIQVALKHLRLELRDYLVLLIYIYFNSTF